MKNPSKEDELKFSLFFLKLYYEKVLEILESIKTPSLIQIGFTKELNEAYCQLVNDIEKILNLPGSLALKNEAPYLYQSLSGELTEIDYTWHEYKQTLYSFLNKIDKQFIEVADKSGELDKIFDGLKESANKNIRELIKENQNHLKHASEGIIKNTDKVNEFKTRLEETRDRKSDRIFEWIKKDGILKIKGQDPIEFRGFRGNLVDFFYNQGGERKWLSYNDIRHGIGGTEKAEDIRKAIEKINQRIVKETKNKYEGIIEVKLEENQKKEKKYQWKY